MGVYKLNSFLNSNKGPGRIQRLKYLPKINHYFIDANGIFHEVAQKVFAYRQSGFTNNQEAEEFHRRYLRAHGTNWIDLMTIYQAELYAAFEALLERINPSDTFCVCVDGVAPGAKVAQQRNRRFGGAPNISYKYVDAQFTKAETGFSTTFITPGTDFMKIVHDYMISWFDMISIKRPGILFIYSSYLLPGEGEHKIFRIIAEDQYDSFKLNQNYAVEGVDGDLISLTILRPQTILLIRSERNNFINMADFKKFVWEGMGFDFKNNKNNSHLILQDFVLILYMIGNDFLPKFLFVEDVSSTITAMMECYRNTVKAPLTTSNAQIDWNSMEHYLGCLSQVEEDFLRIKTNTSYYYKHPILNSREAERLLNSNSEKYFQHIREEYYRSILLPKDKRAQSLLSDFEIENEIDRACQDICDGMQWVLKYYSGQEFDYSYSYKRDATPLIVDIWRYLQVQSIEKEPVSLNSSLQFNVISQLMSVIPLKYNDLVPKPFNQAVQEGGEFNYLCPIGFPVKREGLKEEDFFMQKAVLPLVDARKMIEYVNDRADMWPRDAIEIINGNHELLFFRK